MANIVPARCRLSMKGVKMSTGMVLEKAMNMKNKINEHATQRLHMI